MTRAPAIATPYVGARAVVRPEWIDYNGHMNVGYYHVAFDAAAEPFFELLGLPQELLERLVAVKAAHGALPRPWQLGHVMSARPLARPLGGC